MKNILSILLAFLLLLPLVGCVSQEDKIQDPVNFYYRKSDMDYGTADGVIISEIRDASGHRNDYRYLLSLYLQGPDSYTLYRPFPRTTSLVSLELRDKTAYVILNDDFATLTGLDLTIACACLTLTVCELTGAQQTCISTATALLDGSQSVTVSPDDFLLLDDSNIVIDPD